MLATSADLLRHLPVNSVEVAGVAAPQMGTWSGDEQGSIHDIFSDGVDSSDGRECEPEPTTVLDILRERSCLESRQRYVASPILEEPALGNCECEGSPCSEHDIIDLEFQQEFDAIIDRVSPTAESKEYRAQVYAFVAHLLKGQEGCIEVCAFGSVPLETYLPDGDIDICAFFTCEASDGLTNVHLMLQRKAEGDNMFKIDSDIQLVFAGVPVVKCVIGGIPVDISANQVRGLSAVCFLNSVDRALGHRHLFKRSIVAIKVWCVYESRILGSQGGLLPSYAVEIMVLNILQRYRHCTTPAAVLYNFLQCYAKFDWDKCTLALPEPTLDEVSLYRSDLDGTQDFFVPKFMNISDPLDKANNLGRSVNQASFRRTQHALRLGAKCMKHHILGKAQGARSFLRATSRLIQHTFQNRPDVQPVVKRWAGEISSIAGLHSLQFDLRAQHQKLEELKAKFVSGGVETIMPAVPMGRVMGRVLRSWRLSIADIPASSTASAASTPETPSSVGYAAVPVLDASCGWEETPTKASRDRGGLSESGLEILGHLRSEVLDLVPGGLAHARRQPAHSSSSQCPWSASAGETHRRASKDSRNNAPAQPARPPPASFQQDVHLWPDLAPKAGSSQESSPHSHHLHPWSSVGPAETTAKPIQQDARLLGPPVHAAEPAPSPEPRAGGSSWAALASGRKVEPPKPAAVSPSLAAPKNAWALGRPSSLVVPHSTQSSQRAEEAAGSSGSGLARARPSNSQDRAGRYNGTQPGQPTRGARSGERADSRSDGKRDSRQGKQSHGGKPDSRGRNARDKGQKSGGDGGSDWTEVKSARRGHRAS